jgi:hypothetical protein
MGEIKSLGVLRLRTSQKPGRFAQDDDSVGSPNKLFTVLKFSDTTCNQKTHNF